MKPQAALMAAEPPESLPLVSIKRIIGNHCILGMISELVYLSIAFLAHQRHDSFSSEVASNFPFCASGHRSLAFSQGLWLDWILTAVPM